MEYLPMIGFIVLVVLLSWLMMLPAKKRRKRLEGIPVMIQQKVKELFPGQEDRKSVV